MTFRAVYPNAKEFKRIMDVMGALVGEVCIEPSSDGISARAMDPSHVAMVNFEMASSEFEEYSCDDDHLIGLDLDFVRKILSRASSNDKIELYLNELKNILEIKFISESKVRNFSMPLFSVQPSSIKVPDFQYECSADIKSSVLIDAIKDIKLVSDMVSFHAFEKSLTISANSDDSKKYHITLTESSPEVSRLYRDSNCEEAKAYYALPYVDDITKHLSGKGDITLQFSNSAPMNMSYNIGGAKFGFILAPRIVDE